MNEVNGKTRKVQVTVYRRSERNGSASLRQDRASRRPPCWPRTRAQEAGIKGRALGLSPQLDGKAVLRHSRTSTIYITIKCQNFDLIFYSFLAVRRIVQQFISYFYKFYTSKNRLIIYKSSFFLIYILIYYKKFDS